MAKFRNRLKQRRRIFLREWRAFRGLTQQQLADRIEATVGAISQLETGRVAYTQPMLEALAEALNCEPQDIIMRNPQDTGAIWSLWESAKPAERAQIEQLARVLLDRTGTDN